MSDLRTPLAAWHEAHGAKMARVAYAHSVRVLLVDTSIAMRAF